MNQGKAAMFDTTPKVFARSQELESMGLRVPQVTAIMTRLRNMGCPVPSGVLTLAQAVRALLPLVKREEEDHAQ